MCEKLPTQHDGIASRRRKLRTQPQPCPSGEAALICNIASLLRPYVTLFSHEFYETDDKVTISIFERGADPEKVKVDLTPTSVCIHCIPHIPLTDPTDVP